MTAIHWSDFDRDHLRGAALRWLLAGGLILGLHGVVAYGALILKEAAPAAEPPPAAVMIELAPLPVSLPTPQEEVAPGPQMVEAPQTTPDAPDTPDDAAPEPVKREVVEPDMPEPTPPEPAVAQRTLAEDMPLPPPTPARSQVVLPEPAKAKAERDEPKPAPRRATPKPEAKPKPRRVEREGKPTRRMEAPSTSAPSSSRAAAARRTAAPSRGASASSAVSRASWAAQISAHLNRFKRYPSGARGVSGRPAVRFTLNGSGGVTSVSLTRSSGNSALDAEAVATVRRASPFPRPPDGRGASFSVPVNFVSR